MPVRSRDGGYSCRFLVPVVQVLRCDSGYSPEPHGNYIPDKDVEKCLGVISVSESAPPDDCIISCGLRRRE